MKKCKWAKSVENHVKMQLVFCNSLIDNGLGKVLSAGGGRKCSCCAEKCGTPHQAEPSRWPFVYMRS